MLISDGYFVNSPEQVIASSIWLQPPQKRNNIWVEIFALPFYHIIEAVLIGGKWKIRPGGRSARSKGQSGRMGGLIKGRAKIIASINRQIGKGLRRSFNPELVPFVKAIKVWLDFNGVWLFVEPFPNCSIQITNVFFCTPNPISGAIDSCITNVLFEA